MKKYETTQGAFINQGKIDYNNIGQMLELNIGMILDDKYEIRREIARGGMGIVYEAYHRYVHRKVALKIILSNKIETLQLKRFQKEIDAYSRLSHPNVIMVYDAGIYQNYPYIVMEYIDGMNIRKYIEEHDEAYGQQQLENSEKKERDWKLCAQLIYEVALGLEYIHQQKMFHRDLKPSNIIIRSNGSPVIIDLGLVKFDQEKSYNLTRRGDTVGTFQYMPIEQAKGKQGEIDARSDVYSLGLVLYELLTEKMAYSGTNIIDTFYQIVTYYPPLPRDINPQIPEILDEIVIHATEKKKEYRYASAQEFANALKVYLDDPNAKATSQYAYYKKRLWLQKNKNKIITSCIAVLLVFIASIGIIAQQVITKSTKIAEQYTFGTMYYYGKGVKQNFEKAKDWFEKAATANDANAQIMLGNIYYNGQGVEQNFFKAFEWYEKAAIQDFAEAQFKLGVMYENGQSVEQDYQKAFKWYEKAAMQDFAEAYSKVGIMYESGQGVEQDYQKAFEWYEKATMQKNAEK